MNTYKITVYISGVGYDEYVWKGLNEKDCIDSFLKNFSFFKWQVKNIKLIQEGAK